MSVPSKSNRSSSLPVLHTRPTRSNPKVRRNPHLTSPRADEVPIDDDAPTTHEQFQDGQRRNAKMLQQCLRFLQRVGKTQPEVLSVERRIAFMRDRLADTAASSRKEE